MASSRSAWAAARSPGAFQEPLWSEWATVVASPAAFAEATGCRLAILAVLAPNLAPSRLLVVPLGRSTLPWPATDDRRLRYLLKLS